MATYLNIEKTSKPLTLEDAANQTLDSNLTLNDSVKVNNNATYDEECCRHKRDPALYHTETTDSPDMKVWNNSPGVDHCSESNGSVTEFYGSSSRAAPSYGGSIQLLFGSNNLGGEPSECRLACENHVKNVEPAELYWSENMDIPLRSNVETPNEEEGCKLNVETRTQSLNLPSSSNSEALWNNVWKDDVEKCPNKVTNGGLGNCIRPRLHRDSDEDSWSGNEGEEESCVYTYKGNIQADLPRSFMAEDRAANVPNPEVNEIEPARVNRSGSSSPDNEFLEMDFDPDHSLDLDESEDLEMRVSPSPELAPQQPLEENDLSVVSEGDDTNEIVEVNVKEQPQPGPSSRPDNAVLPPPSRSDPPPLPLQTSHCQPALVHREWSARDSWGHHKSSGDLCSPLSAGDASENDSTDSLALWSSTHNLTCGRVDGEGSDPKKYNLFSDFYHSIMAKRLVMEKNASFTESGSSSCSGDPETPVERTMVWSELEACSKQVTQISTSACGATAAINAMMALNFPFSLDKIKKGVSTRLRLENGPLPQYLESRSAAGSTHEDIIRGLQVASDGKLYARFFHMHPERRFSLSKWLSYWLRKGAIPVATLNLQAGLPPGAPIPDAWHHQMIFGVSPRGVFLTNPLECVPEGALMPQLCSPSVLKVKRSDVVQRWTTSTDLTPLFRPVDHRWKKLNVLGQVVNVVRESANSSSGRVVTQHVTIPAAYKSGVTLIMTEDSQHCQLLRDADELPILTEGTFDVS